MTWAVICTWEGVTFDGGGSGLDFLRSVAMVVMLVKMIESFFSSMSPLWRSFSWGGSAGLKWLWPCWGKERHQMRAYMPHLHCRNLISHNLVCGLCGYPKEWNWCREKLVISHNLTHYVDKHPFIPPTCADVTLNYSIRGSYKSTSFTLTDHSQLHIHYQNHSY